MTMKSNTDIRTEIKKAGLYYWQIAQALKIHETTLCRRLRKELSSQEKESIMQAINSLTKSSKAS